jgi:hypothetical protein
MADKLWLLARINLLQGLAPAEIERMSQLAVQPVPARLAHLLFEVSRAEEQRAH